MTQRPLIRWKLPEILVQERITAYTLERVLEGYLAPSTIYGVCAQSEPKNINLNTLSWILWALRQATGRDYAPSDLLEYSEPPGFF